MSQISSTLVKGVKGLSVYKIETQVLILRIKYLIDDVNNKVQLLELLYNISEVYHCTQTE